MPRITRNAATVFVLIYQRYRRSVLDGVSDTRSRYIGDSYDVIRLFDLDMDVEQVSRILFQLSRYDLISAQVGNNIANECELTDDGIALMESLPFELSAKILKHAGPAVLDAIIAAISG